MGKFITSSKSSYQVSTDNFGLYNVSGLLNSDGENWERLRRFTLRQLRDFGFGKNSMEETIMVEVNEFLDILNAQGEKPLDKVKEKLLLAVVNSVWSISAGSRYKQDDKALLSMTEYANEYGFQNNSYRSNTYDT
jgi:hypothetical protein